eukprot:TRINITY_DN503_c2_g1_i10.p1 TRINITY_DN503_c2_g1~~TRINITY_DN503_c2_g1_i10.p1  ORF type:complete len:277 (-),score=59.45 TRINITY_DN503_c2_g1_i10:2209-3018(-)
MDKRRWREPRANDIDGRNQVCGKNYAAGVMACCVGPADEGGGGYILLGQQDCTFVHTVAQAFGKDMSEKQGWCHFQGWQDKGDLNAEHTAAREGAEESLEVIGSMHMLMEALHDVGGGAVEEIFQGCFLLFMGELSAARRLEIEERFIAKRRWTIDPTKREMRCVRWIAAEELHRAVQHREGYCSAFTDSPAAAGAVQAIGADGREHDTLPTAGAIVPDHRLRRFLHACLRHCSWERGMLAAMVEGRNPCPSARIRFQEWLDNEWVART